MTDSMLWLSTDDVLRLHKGAIDGFGGRKGLRDKALLESALGRPQNLAAYADVGPHELAASYMEGISQNHPFADGNKRTAFLAGADFLDRHGFTITANPTDLENSIVDLAQSKVSRSDVATFLEQNTTYDASRDYRVCHEAEATGASQKPDSSAATSSATLFSRPSTNSRPQPLSTPANSTGLR